MAESDNRVQMGNAQDISRELGPAVAKANPTAMSRTSESQARADAYSAANNKEILPEHQARRDALPHITAANA